MFNNINIDGTGADDVTASRFSSPHFGAAFFSYTDNGSATFNTLTTSNIELPELYLTLDGFDLVIQ